MMEGSTGVTYVIEFAVHLGQRDRFLQLLTGVLDAMLVETTDRGAALHEDPADPARFMLHETWADHEDVVHVQLARSCRRAWHEALPELLVRERVIATWRPVISDAFVRERSRA